MIRLLKPLEYYEQKYGTWMYGLNKLYLLMEKQHNRGQEGAGLALCEAGGQSRRGIHVSRTRLGFGEPSLRYLTTVHTNFRDLTSEQLHDADYAKKCFPLLARSTWGTCATAQRASPD